MASNYSFKNRLADNQSKIGGNRSTLLAKLDPASLDDEPDLQADRTTTKTQDTPSPADQAQTAQAAPANSAAIPPTTDQGSSQDEGDESTPKDPDFISILPPDSQQAARFYNAIKPVITQGLAPDDKRFFQAQQEKYDQMEQKARDTFETNKNIDQWGAVGEKIAQAVAQLGAGLYGVKHGVDMSGLKFDKTDWNQQYNNNLEELNQNLNQLEKSRSRTERAQEIATSAANQQESQEGNFLTGDYENQSHLANSEANRKAQEAKEDTKLAQQKGIEDQKLALEKQKLGIEQQKADQMGQSKKVDNPNKQAFDQLTKADQAIVTGLAKDNSGKTATVNALESNMKDWDSLNDSQKYERGKELIRLLNAAPGGQRLPQKTVDDIGAKLDFALGNFRNDRPMQFGRDMKGFKDQVDNFVVTQKGAIDANQKEIDKRLPPTSAPSSLGKAKTVTQGGHTYTLNPETGEYE